MICYCKNVTKTEIEQTVLNGAITLADIQKMTGACTGNKCKELNPSGECCSKDIKALLNDNYLTNDKPCCCC